MLFMPSTERAKPQNFSTFLMAQHFPINWLIPSFIKKKNKKNVNGKINNFDFVSLKTLSFKLIHNLEMALSVPSICDTNKYMI